MDSFTLRTEIPVLLLQLMESGISVTFEPTRFDDKMRVTWSSVYSNFVKYEEEMRGEFEVDLDFTAHGANAIALERELKKVVVKVAAFEVSMYEDEES